MWVLVETTRYRQTLFGTRVSIGSDVAWCLVPLWHVVLHASRTASWHNAKTRPRKDARICCNGYKSLILSFVSTAVFDSEFRIHCGRRLYGTCNTEHFFRNSCKRCIFQYTEAVLSINVGKGLMLLTQRISSCQCCV